MKTELIKEFEEKHKRSRFLQDTGIGDMHSEQGCYCDEYVEFLEQKQANGAEHSTSNCNIPLVSGSAFIAKADRENILVLVDDKYKVFNKLREIGKTWKSITIEQIDKVV